MDCYHNGEPKVKERIQDEPWYPPYQALMEVANRTGHTEVNDLIQAFLDNYEIQWGDSLTFEMIRRWAVLHACINRNIVEDRT